MQSLDYRVNSYHIFLSILGFHEYGEVISQIYPRPFCPINSSFSGTPPPITSFYSSNSTFLAAALFESSKISSEAPSSPILKPSIILFVKRWPSTSSSLRLVLHSTFCAFSRIPVHPQFILLNIFLLLSLFFFYLQNH